MTIGYRGYRKEHPMRYHALFGAAAGTVGTVALNSPTYTDTACESLP